MRPNGSTVPCRLCGRPFYAQAYRLAATPRPFCSESCVLAWQRAEDEARRRDFTCLRCEQPFTLHPSDAGRGRGAFCSRACWLAWHADPARFWERVDRSAGAAACWPWAARYSDQGYGYVCFGRRPTGAHRVAWRLSNGRDVPPGKVIRHLCHNKTCCNPAHLALGTHADNTRDTWAAGRARFASGDTSGSRKLSSEQVRRIRQLAAAEVPMRELARRYGVCYTTVWHVVRRKTWRDVGEHQ